MMRYCIVLLLFIQSSVSEALPAQSSNLISHNELMRLLTGLLCVLLLIICLSWVVKRLNLVKLSSSKGFQSIATMTLGAREKIIMLKAGDRYLLIGVGTSSISLLHDFGDQLPQEFCLENKLPFKEVLKSTLGKSIK